jgi:hypothetical protein
MTWDLSNDRDEGVMLKLAPAYADNPTERLEEAATTLILPNYQASFSYLYEELNGNREWREDWDGVDLQSLPLAVYVRFTPLDDAQDQRETLEIVARVLANEHRNIRPNSLRITQ